MLLIGFLHTFATVCLVLGILAVLAYGVPSSLPGRVAIALRG